MKKLRRERRRLNNSYQVPQLVSDTARLGHGVFCAGWPDSRVCGHRPFLMRKKDSTCFQFGKSQLADPGHKPISGTNAVRAYVPTSAGDVSSHEAPHNGHSTARRRGEPPQHSTVRQHLPNVTLDKGRPPRAHPGWFHLHVTFPCITIRSAKYLCIFLQVFSHFY